MGLNRAGIDPNRPEMGRIWAHGALYGPKGAQWGPKRRIPGSPRLCSLPQGHFSPEKIAFGVFGNDFSDVDKGKVQEQDITITNFHNKHKSARLRWVLPTDFPSQKVFQAYSHPVVDNSKENFIFGTPDQDNIRLFCRQKIGWDTVEIDRALSPVLKKLQSGSRQTRLDGFFMRYEDNHIVSHHIKSKRLRKVLRSATEK